MLSLWARVYRAINSAYRLQSSLPHFTYTILESRDSLGGTWDLFRYPGIRSDSDMLQFGFEWYPWNGDVSMASGPAIKNYMHEATRSCGIDQKIRYCHRVYAADWSSEQAGWRLSAKTSDGNVQLFARFLLLCTGYYDYEKPMVSAIQGIENFKGTVIHPQFWPEHFDYEEKNIIVIGSGATSVTLVPKLAEKAARVTMLQRSPTYIAARPNIDAFGKTLKRYLPPWIARSLTRSKNLLVGYLFIKFCKTYPVKARIALQRATAKLLPAGIPPDPHFAPRYNPWEQRLCVAADGDFFAALRSGKATVVTDQITTVTATGIELTSGRIIQADTIITATGLCLKIGGGIALTVDKEPVQTGDRYLWRTCMLDRVPNMSIVIGYANLSWTLGADVTAHFLCRLLKHMHSTETRVATPRLSDEEASGLRTLPLLDLSSTYVVKGADQLPKTGDKAPWQPRSSYFRDLWIARFANVTRGLELRKALE